MCWFCGAVVAVYMLLSSFGLGFIFFYFLFFWPFQNPPPPQVLQTKQNHLS